MLEKIKGLMQLKDEMDLIREKFVLQNEALEKMNMEVATLKNQILEVKQNQMEFVEMQRAIMDNLRVNIGEINEIHNKYKEELDKFFVIKKDITSKVMKRFENEMSEQLVKHSDELKIKTDDYRRLKEELEKLGGSMAGLNSEVVKLKAVSSSIKKGDFELKKFAKELSDADRHKLELMQRIDNLERLIAKMRRRH